jgi:hypothetical protein
MEDCDLAVMLRVPVAEWKPAMEVARSQGSTLTDAIRDFLRWYVAESHPRTRPTTVMSTDDVHKREDIEGVLSAHAGR